MVDYFSKEPDVTVEVTVWCVFVGEVKEKETAHREYKAAISEGHGAYLMDQDEETPVCTHYSDSLGVIPTNNIIRFIMINNSHQKGLIEVY